MKTFIGITIENRVPVAKRFWQTPFFRHQLRALLVMGSFLPKLKTMTTSFELYTFDYDLEDNVYGRWNPSQTFLWVWLHLQKFHEIASGEVTF